MNKHRKQLLSLLLALVLFASLSLPALADAGISNTIKGGSGTVAQPSGTPSLRSQFNRASNASKVKSPNASDYFTYMTAMYADAPKGHSIYAYDHWQTDVNSHFGYIFHGSRVYVLAEHGESYCVLYYTDKNKLNVAWVPIERLSYSYPGRVYRLGGKADTGSATVSDPTVSWSRDNFVGTGIKYTVLAVPAENCLAFTLDYQMISKSATKNEVLGPRAVYINDGSGWSYIGYFDYDEEGAVHVEVTLSSPVTLRAVATIPDCAEPNGFAFRQSLIDVKTK